jgi:protein TonB
MALAMSGATGLLLGLAVSMLHLPKARANRPLAEGHDTRELEVQLVALATGPDIAAEAPTPTEARALLAAAAPRVKTKALQPPIAEPRVTPVLFEAPPPAPALEAAASTGGPAAATHAEGQPATAAGPAASASRGDAQGHADEIAGSVERAPAPVEVVPFGEGMTPPRLLTGSPPAYSAQALAARVEGKVIVRCVITQAGDARDCRIIKPLPLLDRAAVRALLASRFVPATFRGQSVAVSYLFTYDFKLP